MSQDKMQDVFPIEIDFVGGEQPHSDKLTGWGKQTDSAFSRVVSAIGDPWEYNVHTVGSSSIEYYLSPSRLAQPSLSRMIGPSDYLSPQGASFNEAITNAANLTLEQDRNSWRVGFPLKKKWGPDMLPNSASGYAGSLTDLVFDTDITLVSGPDGEFLAENLKTYAEGVQASGDWFIDFDKGIIQTYNVMSSATVLQVEHMNMFGPGTPWGTANVIPSWEQTNSICTAANVGPTTWTITLPLVTTGPRSGGSTRAPDALWDTTVPGESASYKLPSAITSVLSAGEVIPSGFMQLWEETTSRILPLVEFIYADEYSVTVTAPENWLTTGEKYRIIVTGSSVAENVSWLMSAFRDTAHEGMSDCQDGRTIAFTNPISHDNISDLYGGLLPSSTIRPEKYKYTASYSPTNCHPQYIHRAGFMSSDIGNSNNAMRGDFVLAGAYDSSLEKFPVGNATTLTDSGGLSTETYAISFGGNTESQTNTNPRIKWEGGEAISSWAMNSARRIGFGLSGTGLRSHTSSNVFGALTVYEHEGMPLYLKGISTTDTDDIPYDAGGSLGFDFNRQNEMNFIKMTAGSRLLADSKEARNVGVDAGGDRTTPLAITPSMTGPLSSYQMREFRFRSNPYVPEAQSISGSIGDENGIDEFNYYFTSPSIVGVDFLNVYSNAIFFSARGDGASTSFTTRGEGWLENSEDNPIGIYYEPELFNYSGSYQGAFTFHTGFAGDVYRDVALTLSRYGQSTLRGNEYVGLLSDTKVEAIAPVIDLTATTSVTLSSVASVIIDSDVLDINVASDITLDSGADITSTCSSGTYTVTAGIIDLKSSSDINIEGTQGIDVISGRELVLESGVYNTGSGSNNRIQLNNIPEFANHGLVPASPAFANGLYTLAGDKTLYINK